MWIHLDGGTDAVLAARRRLWTVAVWCAAFLIPLWLWTTPAGAGEDDTSPGALVRSYLEAIRDGDVDRALDIAGVRPTGEEAAFLTPAALDRDWVVNSVSVEEDPFRWTTVEVVITSGAGVTATGSFDLEREGEADPWRFEDPLIRTSIRPSPLWYVEINGVTVPYQGDEKASLGERWPFFLLLPGVYRFYADVPGLFDVPGDAVPMLPGSPHRLNDDLATVAVGPFTLEAGGVERAQAALNAYIDDCTRMGDKSLAGCPFGVELVLDPRDDDNYFPDYRDIEWKVTKYPVVAVGPGGDGLALTHREAGAATFTATVLDGEESLRVEMSCPILADGLELGILPGGEFRIIPAWTRWATEIDHDPYRWQTC